MASRAWLCVSLLLVAALLLPGVALARTTPARSLLQNTCANAVHSFIWFKGSGTGAATTRCNLCSSNTGDVFKCDTLNKARFCFYEKSCTSFSLFYRDAASAFKTTGGTNLCRSAATAGCLLTVTKTDGIWAVTNPLGCVPNTAGFAGWDNTLAGVGPTGSLFPDCIKVTPVPGSDSCVDIALNCKDVSGGCRLSVSHIEVKCNTCTDPPAVPCKAKPVASPPQYYKCMAERAQVRIELVKCMAGYVACKGDLTKCTGKKCVCSGAACSDVSLTAQAADYSCGINEVCIDAPATASQAMECGPGDDSCRQGVCTASTDATDTADCVDNTSCKRSVVNLFRNGCTAAETLNGCKEQRAIVSVNTVPECVNEAGVLCGFIKGVLTSETSACQSTSFIPCATATCAAHCYDCDTGSVALETCPAP